MRAFRHVTAALAAAALSGPAAAAAREIAVPGDVPAIQAAVDAAADGDVVRVDAGTYGESVVWRGKRITLRGAGPDKTILEPHDARCLTLSDPPKDARVESLACRNGRADRGAGILVERGALELAHVLLEGNEATISGGGLFARGADLTISDSTFREDHANLTGEPNPSLPPDHYRGGAILLDGGSLRISGSTFVGNSGRRRGGVVALQGMVDVDSSTFEDNFGGIEVEGGALRAIGSLFRGNDATPGAGGGIHLQDSTGEIDTCTFVDNAAKAGGGGVATSGSDLRVSASVFRDNATDFGGALAASGGTTTIAGTIFEANATDEGGGALSFAGGSARITGSTFTRNEARYWGGGLWVAGKGVVTVEASVFQENSAKTGGGIYVTKDAQAALTGCVLHGNTARESGGGVLVDAGGAAVLLHDTFHANTAATRGGGLDVEPAGRARVVNSIFWQDMGGELAGAGALDISFSDVQGGAPGSGNLDADPLFRDVARGDYHLDPGSPAIDAGTSVSDLPRTDLEGAPRVQGAAPDMGAYESLCQRGPLFTAIASRACCSRPSP